MIPLIISYILNIIDYIFTAYWVYKYGIDIEANPIGRWMFENNVAWVFKIVVVGLLFAVLGYLVKRHKKAVTAAYIVLVVYGLIVLYHVAIAIRIWCIRW